LYFHGKGSRSIAVPPKSQRWQDREFSGNMSQTKNWSACGVLSYWVAEVDGSQPSLNDFWVLLHFSISISRVGGGLKEVFGATNKTCSRRRYLVFSPNTTTDFRRTVLIELSRRRQLFDQKYIILYVFKMYLHLFFTTMLYALYFMRIINGFSRATIKISRKPSE